jgi:DivIVA domain-containing protein
MAWLFALLALGIVVAFGLVIAGRLPAVPQPTIHRYLVRLPEHPSPADVDQLRFPVAVRGYRMDDVDTALAALRNRIAELEADAGAAADGEVPTDVPFAPGGDGSAP